MLQCYSYDEITANCLICVQQWRFSCSQILSCDLSGFRLYSGVDTCLPKNWISLQFFEKRLFRYWNHLYYVSLHPGLLPLEMDPISSWIWNTPSCWICVSYLILHFTGHWIAFYIVLAKRKTFCSHSVFPTLIYENSSLGALMQWSRVVGRNWLGRLRIWFANNWFHVCSEVWFWRQLGQGWATTVWKLGSQPLCCCAKLWTGETSDSQMC